MSRAPLPIASLETEVPVSRSVQQIQQLAERFGASEFSLQYDPVSGRPVAVAFRIRDPHLTRAAGGEGVYIPIALRAPFEIVRKQILDGKRNAHQTEVKRRATEQAERVAWRNLHDFVRASLIGVQTGLMTLGEAFMANVVVTLPTGEAKRLGEIAAEGGLIRHDAGGRLMLGRGSE